MKYQTPFHTSLCYLSLLTFLLMPPSIFTMDHQDDLKDLCLASQYGNINDVQKIITKNPTLINQIFTTLNKGNFKGTALHYAVGPKSIPNVAVVDYLLAHEFDPNLQNNKKDTPLHCALRHKRNDDIVRALINAGTQLFRQNNFGDTPLHCAIYEGRMRQVEMFLTNKAPLDVLNQRGHSVLSQSVKPQIMQRYGTRQTEVAQLLRYAHMFNEAEDKVDFITQPVTPKISLKAQHLAFRTLVETCELNDLLELHDHLWYDRSAFLCNLLKQVPIKMNKRAIKYASNYSRALYAYWVTMPLKIIPYVQQGKLDQGLEALRTVMIQTKLNAPLMIAIFKRCNEVNMYQQFKNKQFLDTNFRFVCP